MTDRNRQNSPASWNLLSVDGRARIGSAAPGEQ